jgi:hypothetical protein
MATSLFRASALATREEPCRVDTWSSAQACCVEYTTEASTSQQSRGVTFAEPRPEARRVVDASISQQRPPPGALRPCPLARMRRRETSWSRYLAATTSQSVAFSPRGGAVIRRLCIKCMKCFSMTPGRGSSAAFVNDAASFTILCLDVSPDQTIVPHYAVSQMRRYPRSVVGNAQAMTRTSYQEVSALHHELETFRYNKLSN